MFLLKEFLHEPIQVYVYLDPCVLKQADVGKAVPDRSRDHGIYTATFYKWRKTYGGMDVSLLTRMKELEEEKYKRGFRPFRCCYRRYDKGGTVKSSTSPHCKEKCLHTVLWKAICFICQYRGGRLLMFLDRM